MRHIEEPTANEALRRWLTHVDQCVHVATSGNSVYHVVSGGERYALRLTDPEHRTGPENEAETEFIRHLVAQALPVASPVASRAGRFVEEVEGVSASLFGWIDGEEVDWTGPHWQAGFFRAWGRALGAIHRASIGYRGAPRWEWQDERLLGQAEALIPEDDLVSRAELALTMRELAPLPRTEQEYGMIHADFAPLNFRFSPPDRIMAFDFGNCCRHWFVQDIAISLLFFRRDAGREGFATAFLAGYQEARPIPAETWRGLGSLMRLRILYVYLSRLKKFGPSPAPTERAILSNLRLAVAERFAWEPRLP
ncbi:MAG: phosphotransferase [Candidatus Eisenbacteria bacterium]|nr:phosphotransferase [Candidatus Eisenbacteria bacterium]